MDSRNKSSQLNFFWRWAYCAQTFKYRINQYLTSLYKGNDRFSSNPKMITPCTLVRAVKLVNPNSITRKEPILFKDLVTNEEFRVSWDEVKEYKYQEFDLLVVVEEGWHQ